MQLAQHVCIGLVQRPALLLDGGAPVLKQRDDVVDMLRLVGLEREEPLEILDGHVGDLADCVSFHARHRSREDDTPAPLHSSQLEA